jgi:quinol monooxygenase YgiN
MAFVQIIEYETRRADELAKLLDEWMRATEGKRTVTRELHTQDRDNPSRFVDIVEFPSYEQAMRNNDLPETNAIAERMRALCTREPRFLNVEVLRDEAA